MEHIGAAFLLAQDVVGRADIEQQHAALAPDVGDRQQLLGRDVGEHIAVAPGDHVAKDLHDFGVRLHLGDVERELLAHELAGRVVVGDRHIGAGNAFVARRHVEHRERQFRLIGAQIADPDLGRLPRLRRLLRQGRPSVDASPEKSEKTARVYGTMPFIAGVLPRSVSRQSAGHAVQVVFGADDDPSAAFPDRKARNLPFHGRFIGGRRAGAADRVAVFEFELQHGDLVPGAPSNMEAQDRRRAMITARLRDHLAKSGFDVVDTQPLAAKAAAANLQACGNCADDFARELGAEYAFTGVVYKVSELILSMSVFVHEAATSRPVAGAIDLRGNTDESWRRAIDYLYRNVLAARLERLSR